MQIDLSDFERKIGEMGQARAWGYVEVTIRAEIHSGRVVSMTTTCADKQVRKHNGTLDSDGD